MSSDNTTVWETFTFSWHVFAKRESTVEKWFAFVEPVEEAIQTGRIVYAPEGFLSLLDAKKWCFNTVYNYWMVIFERWRISPSKAQIELQNIILSRLQLYHPIIVATLLETTLEIWGDKLIKLRQTTHQKFVSNEGVLYEPAALFWEITKQRPFNFSNNQVRLAHGLSLMSSKQINREAKEWAISLVQLPFYETINVFTQAVETWLETTDLSPITIKNQSQVETMRNFLRLFER